MQQVDVDPYSAYGNSVAEVDIDSLPDAQRRRYEVFQQLRRVVEEHASGE